MMNDENNRSAEDLTVDAALQQLDGIVAQLENGSLSLEESFALYERGMKLADTCDAMITAIEQKVRVISQDGEITDGTDRF